MTLPMLVGLPWLLSIAPLPAAQFRARPCSEVPALAERLRSPDKHNDVELSPEDVKTVIFAARELAAICALVASATTVQANRRDTLAELVFSAVQMTHRNRPGGGYAMINVYSAVSDPMKTLADAICGPGYVNVEPFIVAKAGGPRQKPVEGYVLIQRTEGGEAAFIWRELVAGGAAIPNPGREYTVTVIAFLDGGAYRVRQPVNSDAFIPVPGRPRCRVLAPQLVPARG